jgi:histidinol phosphatase-like enzyme (inositol monophosphatase family)
VSEHRDFACELARAAAEHVLRWYRDPALRIERKGDSSPVTIADRDAEQAMRQMIAARYPSHGVLGEEFGAFQVEADWVWLLDPIDGTKSFITGVPLFGTMVALAHRGVPVLGLIHQPVLGHMVVGDGVTTTLNDAPVRVRPCAQVAAATLLSSDALLPGRTQAPAGWAALTSAVHLFRTFGDCYGYALVASGFADIMLDPVLNLWDVAPLLPIIRGAGGQITDWHGQDLAHLNLMETRPLSAVATAGPIHGEVIGLLRGAAAGV